MTKVAIICDTHKGARAEAKHFREHMAEFFQQQFFPTLKKEGVKTIFHLGDIVDRRKYINYVIMRSLRESFIEPALADFNCVFIPGNHDSYYKHSLELHAMDELIPKRPNVAVIDHPTETTFGDRKALFLPWICSANRDASVSAIEHSAASVVFGHLELSGFEAYRGYLMEKGFDPRKFDRFDAVYSGHYHHKSSRANIHYLGAPYELNWSDHGDPKGFHILDLDTLELRFVENQKRMHVKLFYDDSTGRSPDFPDAVDLKDKIVKLIVQQKVDPYQFDKTITAIEAAGVADLKVVEDHKNVDALKDSEVVEGAVTDALQVLDAEVKAPSFDFIRDDLKELFRELYDEAMALRE